MYSLNIIHLIYHRRFIWRKIDHFSFFFSIFYQRKIETKWKQTKNCQTKICVYVKYSEIIFRTDYKTKKERKTLWRIKRYAQWPKCIFQLSAKKKKQKKLRHKIKKAKRVKKVKKSKKRNKFSRRPRKIVETFYGAACWFKMLVTECAGGPTAADL